MKLEEKLQQLKRAAQPSTRDLELERQLEYLRRAGARQGAPLHGSRLLPAQRAPLGIEEYVDGQVERNPRGEFFLARQALPFGRPYGKLRIGDFWTADLSPLNLFLAGATRRVVPTLSATWWLENPVLPETSELVYLDTETTGLAGGTGTCAFLIGIGAIEGSQFALRQFFLRDYPEEKAVLAALAEALERYEGLVTFNGKTFDVPLLETRYALARMKSPFARLLHLDLLHPARRLWKLRLEHCELTHLEKEVLAISREGDVSGSEIPGIYFDYLRTGNARGLQPVFYHNALDIITLAALSVELAQAVGDAGAETLASSLDLFSLSRIFDRVGAREQSVSTCRRALAAGLPQSVEARALWHLASEHKRRREYEQAAGIWIELVRREEDFAIEALEELAIYHEHRRRDARTALEFVEAAIQRVNATASSPHRYLEAFIHRLARLRRKTAGAHDRAH